MSEYQERYREIFEIDFRFSRDFASEIDKLVLQHLSIVRDYERRETEIDKIRDSQGIDREISAKFTFGSRIRRSNALKWREFTVDTKEWNLSTYPNYYFFAYTDHVKHKILFWMIFDYRKLRKLVEEGKIKYGIEQNDEHSGVPFLTFKLKDIFDSHLVIAFGGERSISIELVPKQCLGQQQL